MIPSQHLIAWINEVIVMEHLLPYIFCIIIAPNISIMVIVGNGKLGLHRITTTKKLVLNVENKAFFYLVK
jgi:hypothetical protein